MCDKKFDIVISQHSEMGDRIVGDLKRGVSRSDVIRTLLAGLMGYTFAENVWLDA